MSELLRSILLLCLTVFLFTFSVVFGFMCAIELALYLIKEL